MKGTELPAILIVDDTPANIDVLAGILSPHYRVRAARDGIKALESANSNPPDLILLDIVMPGIDGYEVCRRLKESPLTRSIPVLFVTAKSDDVDEYKGFEVGALDYIPKPVGPLVVLSRVKTHLSLAAAQRELEKRNETLREIVRLREDVERITCHDLKSPLTAIVNIPPMLMRDKNQTPDQIEMLKILHKSGLRMLEMVNRSLDLYKMEQGHYQLNPVPVDVAKIVRQIFAEFGSLIATKKIKPVLSINGSPATETSECYFPGEEFLYFSMLSNLIKNGLEASPVEQEVCVNLHADPGRFIEVKNQGAIPPEILDRFLERYVSHGKTGSAGLGVYSARLMAKTLGGGLRFQSTKEAGTVLTIELSLNQEPSHPPSSPGKTTCAPRKMRTAMEVLVVNAYGYMRKILGCILRDMGFSHIHEAETVAQAQTFLRRTPFDLIISEWNLSDKTCLELLRTVRSRPDGATTPFIIVTGTATEEILVVSQKNDVTDVLAKPFTPDVVRSRIDAIFSEKNSNDRSKSDVERG